MSETVAFIKELIRLFKQESGDGCSISTVLLEKLLVLSQGIGVQVDEVGTCLHPPREISAIKVAFGEDFQRYLRNRI